MQHTCLQIKECSMTEREFREMTMEIYWGGKKEIVFIFQHRLERPVYISPPATMTYVLEEFLPCLTSSQTFPP